jgi:hypothetical protein
MFGIIAITFITTLALLILPTEVAKLIKHNDLNKTEINSTTK